jgi:D-alanyl-D-alanine carboxypeptidase
VIPEGLSAVQSRISEIESQLGVQRMVSKNGPGATTANIGDFDKVLVNALGSSDAVSATGLGSTTPTTKSLTLTDILQSSGALAANGAPADLVRYGNGQIPAIALTSIGQGEHRLWTPAAQSFKAMQAAAARDGVTIDVSDSYRSFDAQVDLADRKGLYSQGGLAAVPGTSDHGWGKALDVDTSGGTVEWLRVHAGEFGFVEDTPREPWHWVFEPT